MNFVLVPDNQPRQQIDFFNYPDESDLDGGTSPTGCIPFPRTCRSRSGRAGTGSQTLSQWQTNNDGSDRHAIMVAPGGGFIWETWETALVGTNWEASNGAKFNLNTNGLRPDGLDFGRRGGFADVPRAGALRRSASAAWWSTRAASWWKSRATRTTFIPPRIMPRRRATRARTCPRWASGCGSRPRFVIPTNWTKEEKAVLLGLKKYGALVADNGNYFSISVTPDDRWPANVFHRFDEHQHHEFRGHPDHRHERRSAVGGRAGGECRPGPDGACRRAGATAGRGGFSATHRPRFSGSCIPARAR